MPEPKRFAALVPGRYHFRADREPHLESECTGECRAAGRVYAVRPGAIVVIEYEASPVSRLELEPQPWPQCVEPGDWTVVSDAELRREADGSWTATLTKYEG